MAISFIGSAEASAANGGNATIDLTAITGLAQNDLVIVAYGIATTAGDFDMAMVTADYIEVADLFADDTRDANLGVFRKFMGATPDTSAEVTGNADGASSTAAVAMAFRGVDLTTPMDVAATTATGINSPHPDPPSIDHANPAGVWTVLAAANSHAAGGAATYTFPTGYTTDALEASADDTHDTTCGLAYNSGPADPEDPGALVHSGGDNNQLSWCAVTMALRPAVAGGETGSVSDGAEAGDTQSAQADTTAAQSDGAEAGDTEAAQADTQASQTDGALAGDTVTGQADTVASVSDGAQAGDTEAAQADTVASTSDGAQAGDTASGQADTVASVADGAVAGDSFTGATGGEETGAVTDGAQAGDSVTAQAAAVASVADGALAGDSFAAQADTAASVTEGALAGDSVEGATAAEAPTVGKGRPRVIYVDRRAVLVFARVTFPDPVVEARPPEYAQDSVAVPGVPATIPQVTVPTRVPVEEPAVLPDRRAFVRATIRIPNPPLQLTPEEAMAVMAALRL